VVFLKAHQEEIQAVEVKAIPKEDHVQLE